MNSIRFLILTLCVLFVSACAPHKEGRHHRGFEGREHQSMRNRSGFNDPMTGRSNMNRTYNDRTNSYSNSNHSNKVEAFTPSLDNSLPYKIVGTNQSRHYSNTRAIGKPGMGERFYGQSANSQNPPAYKDNGDGTITDLNTGLIWQKGFRKITWAEAERDSKNARTGGYTDWRVPTIKELYSLILFNGSTGRGRPNSSRAPSDAVPYIATNYFDFEYSGGRRYIDAQYITSTSYVGKIMNGDEGFFGVNFADGRIKGYPKVRRDGQKFYVRYVRGTKDYGKNKFVDNRDGTISDKATGLMWMQADSGYKLFKDKLLKFTNKDGSLNWEEALKFCEELNFAGKSDWRLPTAKELQSIVDYGRSPSTTYSPSINPVFKTTTILDEGDKKNYPFFWSSTTHLDGRILGANAIYVAFGEALGFMRFPGSWSSNLMDVHGAGAQRSDPKVGDPKDYPKGFGPQGDVRRIFNYVRPVRDIK